MEIPPAVIQYALQFAYERHIPTFLNLAPAYPLADEWLKKVDYFVLNESELGLLTGAEVSDRQAAERAIIRLLDRGAAVVIVTLGSHGALLATPRAIEYFAPHVVNVVDTTAAGDAFVGNFVTSLLNTGDLSTSMKWANAAGALAVTKFGAQDSLPTLQEVRQLLQR